MIKIEITSPDVITYTSKKTGKPYYKQVAWAHLMDRDGKQEPYPQRFLLFVSSNAAGPESYAPGEYRLMPSSLRIDQFGGLEVGFVNLEPIKK